MKQWLTAREIADERLPHIPTTESAVIRMAKREAWDVHPTFARSRAAIGGGVEYHYRLLPSLAQIAYFQRHANVGGAVAEPVGQRLPSAPLTDRAQRERDARLAVLSALESFSRGLKLNQQACIRLFCDRYQMAYINVEPWVKEFIPSLSPRSIHRGSPLSASAAMMN